ncbi:MAG TPA: TolC family protein [Polyangia bacterium]|jgi:outer membrane protein
MTTAAFLLGLTAQVLTLDQAVQTADRAAPQARQARAQTEAARARVTEARAPLLPQVTGAGAYQRTTGNFAPKPGTLPASTPSGPSSWTTHNYFNFGLSASILIWDFGQTSGRWRASAATAESVADTERMTRLQIVLGVRTAFFNARAQKSLVEVAREQLANQERHLKQVEGFVEVGTRPEIDLAQARTDRANARVQLINAENAYAIARAQLNQAMGVEGSTDYDVADDNLPPVPGEDLGTDALMGEAVKGRFDLRSAEQQIRSQELTLRSVRGGYWPALGAATGLTDAGTGLESLTWNWNATLTLTWQIYQGGLTRAQVRENAATLVSLEAQRDSLRQQIRVEVDQARLGVRAAKAATVAADEALTNARVRLRLAEGRYQTGVGNIIELGDAQVALTNAAAQKVQADYNLATARAQLLRALGRR